MKILIYYHGHSRMECNKWWKKRCEMEADGAPIPFGSWSENYNFQFCCRMSYLPSYCNYLINMNGLENKILLEHFQHFVRPRFSKNQNFSFFLLYWGSLSPRTLKYKLNTDVRKIFMALFSLIFLGGGGTLEFLGQMTLLLALCIRL